MLNGSSFLEAKIYNFKIKSHKFDIEAVKNMKKQEENNPVTVKATFHMESGDFTLTFEGQKTFRKINNSKYRTLLLLESVEDMSEEFKAWLDYSFQHGNGPSVPRIKTTVIEYDQEGNITEHYYCTQTSPRRWFKKYDRLREIELDYLTKTKIKE